MILFFDSTYWTYELIAVIAVIIIAYDLLAVIIDTITFYVKTKSKNEQ